MNYIPLSIPNFEGNEKKYVDEAICQGWVSTGGEYINKLEKNLAEFLRVENVAACQSGTSAIHLSLIDAGVMPDDVVIVPTVTFIAAVNPVRYQFATPVFIDCDDSLCMDPAKLREFCENECIHDDDGIKYKGHTVKAIIVVHVFGNMADMEAIMDTASEFGIKVIEDATEALGTKYISGRYDGCYAGTIGDYGCYSFNGNKIITTGGGGAVVAKESENVDHIRYLSTQAKNDQHFYIHDEVGYNYRMTNVQAAIGVAQMEELPDFIKRKQVNYGMYKGLLADFEYGRILDFREGTSSNKWFYSLVINRDKVSLSLREIITKLKEKGIETRALWGLINEQTPYEGMPAYRIDKATYYYDRILNLPSSTQITVEEIEYVVEKIKELLPATK